MEMLNQKQKIIAIIIIAIVIVVIGYYYINSTKEVYSYSEISNAIEDDDENEIEDEEETTNEIIVHITGAVNKSGIVKVKENARINDVIEAAEGITEDADLTNVNLAYIVEDGQKIYIPSINDEVEETIITEEAGVEVIEEEYIEDELININEASLQELITIPGIGEATATKIIEYRETNGDFETVEDIKNVSGIGDAKFNIIVEYITI